MADNTPINTQNVEKDTGYEWTEDSAPSNIALIKYMGKLDSKNNKPTNSSLSWTLSNLKTFVRIRPNPNLLEDHWAPLVRDDLRPIHLSETGLKKYLQFFLVLKTEFKLQGFYEIQSANNFPSDCGLASSASSFAALTKVVNLFSESHYHPKELARISQKGSGSSCRSFFAPWSLWHSDGAEEVMLPIKKLNHLVILCDESKKNVSSSQAHIQVLTSDMFSGRVERAQKRLQNLIQTFRSWGQVNPKGEPVHDQKLQWKTLFEICWNEFWDMHNLFHTSIPAFMYMNAESYWCLKTILDMWQNDSDGPLVTMDAGSNIHLLFREDQMALLNNYKHIFNVNFNLWSDDGYIKLNP